MLQFKKHVALSDTGFLFNPTTGESFSLNPIGIEIVRWLKEGKSVKDITKLIVKEYSVDKATVEKDLYDFVRNLKNYNLIEEVNGK